MKKLEIEITLTKERFSKSCGCYIPGGYEANCINPEIIGYDQLYSGLSDTAEGAMDDILQQVNGSSRVLHSDGRTGTILI